MVTSGRGFVQSKTHARLVRSNEAPPRNDCPGSDCSGSDCPARAVSGGGEAKSSARPDWRRKLRNKLDQFGLPRCIGLGEYFLQVCLDRGQGYAEFVCGILRCLAAHDLLEDVAFGARQSIQFSER